MTYSASVCLNVKSPSLFDHAKVRDRNRPRCDIDEQGSSEGPQITARYERSEECARKICHESVQDFLEYLFDP